MFQLNTKKGKLYINDIEVDATPVYLGLPADIEFGGRIPPLEAVIQDMVVDSYKKGDMNLFKANSYRWFMVSQEFIPEMNVPDGRVPATGKRKIVVDFYYSMPAKREEK